MTNLKKFPIKQKENFKNGWETNNYNLNIDILQEN